MYFWYQCFCLLYIFNYVVAESSDIEFHTIALGHSGLLIYWDPIKIVDASNKLFSFHYRALVENIEKLITETADVKKGQHKLNTSLNEDTQYEITIGESNVFYDSVKNYTIKFKTKCKSNSPPEKPFFKWEYLQKFPYHHIGITWIPCGKERNCHGNEAGTHFAVKYKILDLRKTVTVIQYFSDYLDLLHIYAGKIYEVTVTSINGDFQTDSDTQEIFDEPCSGPVRSVKVLTLTNTSIYVSWKKPQKFGGELFPFSYFLLHNAIDGMNELHWSRPYYRDKEARLEGIFLNKSQHWSIEQKRFNDFKPNTVNKFIILPWNDHCFGFEFRFDYSIQANQADQPLAKPDFKFRRRPDPVLKTPMGKRNTTCFLRVIWLPCTRTFDCKNLSPGSGFQLKIQNDNGTKTFIERKESSIEIEINENQIHKFIGKSVNEGNQSSAEVIKKISCK